MVTTASLGRTGTQGLDRTFLSRAVNRAFSADPRSCSFRVDAFCEDSDPCTPNGARSPTPQDRGRLTDPSVASRHRER